MATIEAIRAGPSLRRWRSLTIHRSVRAGTFVGDGRPA
jgi:hypothetical protein